MANNLEDLIQQAAREKPEYDLEEIDQAHATAVFNHPGVAIVSWCLCLIVGLIQFQYPLPYNNHTATRSVETRLGVALYHVAHRIETYQQSTGELPDFLEPEWNESRFIEYAREGDSYVIKGRLGQIEMIYREGEDPERLVHQAARVTPR